MIDHLATIHEASRAIPQALGQQTQHSQEWRYLLQTVRNADASTTEPKDRLLARIFQASLDVPNVSGSELYAAQKSALLDAINTMAYRHGFQVDDAVGDALPAIFGPSGEVLATAE